MRKVRQRGTIWVGIVVVAVFFAGVTLAVALVGGGPDIPHAAGGDSAACSTCHATSRLPESHRDRVDDGCRSCHSEGEEASAASEPPDGGGALPEADGVAWPASGR